MGRLRRRRPSRSLRRFHPPLRCRQQAVSQRRQRPEIHRGRPQNFGSNGPSVIDYDNDGRLDLFVAGYGRNFLFHNEGGGRFREVAETMGVIGGDKATPSGWGDYDNDGRPDLYVSSYIEKPVNEHDFLFHNDG